MMHRALSLIESIPNCLETITAVAAASVDGRVAARINVVADKLWLARRLVAGSLSRRAPKSTTDYSFPSRAPLNLGCESMGEDHLQGVVMPLAHTDMYRTTQHAESCMEQLGEADQRSDERMSE